MKLIREDRTDLVPIGCAIFGRSEPPEHGFMWMTVADAHPGRVVVVDTSDQNTHMCELQPTGKILILSSDPLKLLEDPHGALASYIRQHAPPRNSRIN